MELADFVASFSRKIDMPDLKLDNDDYCAFTVDDMPVHLQGLKEKNQLLIYGEMGDLPAERNEAFFIALLQMNYLFSGTRGGTIAFQKDSGKLLLQIIIHNFSQLDENAVYDALEDFVNALEELRAFLDNYRLQAEAAPTQQTKPDDLLSPGIRV